MSSENKESLIKNIKDLIKECEELGLKNIDELDEDIKISNAYIAVTGYDNFRVLLIKISLDPFFKEVLISFRGYLKNKLGNLNQDDIKDDSKKEVINILIKNTYILYVLMFFMRDIRGVENGIKEFFINRVGNNKLIKYYFCEIDNEIRKTLSINKRIEYLLKGLKFEIGALSVSNPDEEIIEYFREKSEENPDFYKLIDSFSQDIKSSLDNEASSNLKILLLNNKVEFNDFGIGKDELDYFDDGDDVEEGDDYIDNIFKAAERAFNVSNYLIELLNSVKKKQEKLYPKYDVLHNY
ncbi:hypothetical protein [Gallibacterium anatis]|uniref:hypothetical protein n=1 Tax=Gallibacterium anatis TaxID=750 RepID=UPI002231A0E1|nr:hypothetical protein [Gallibacterium anatis]UZD16819.1 hypothetical protein OLL86_04630 [Gallibacterium anatis]